MVEMNNMDSSGRWENLKKLLERSGPFAANGFTPTEELLPFLLNHLKILVVGAGGLGCELLKDLTMMGFRNIHVIDMDTVDLSNLNRQFLFTHDDIDKPKAVAAASFINKRVSGANIVPHYCRIEDFDDDFYSSFHIFVCGLDSIVARRWINSMAISLLEYDDEGNLNTGSVRPLVDGGTEGFKGNIRVVLPGLTACLECTLDLYPPQVNFPMCTIAHMPRLPEHCIEYVKILLWPQEQPFGEGVSLDGDDPEHIRWVFMQSEKRAAQFRISGVTYRLTQGVVKRIIPAVASTNAVIAAACATEVFKIATNCASSLDNYMNFNDGEGVYMYSFQAEKQAHCLVCSHSPQALSVNDKTKLQEIIDILKESIRYQMRGPSLTAIINGKNRTLFMPSAALAEQTKPNLKKTLSELGIQNGQSIFVADPTNPRVVTFKLNFENNKCYENADIMTS